MSVQKRGSRWCVIHCHGEKKGSAIKCFPTKKKALKMHRAIMWSKSKARIS